MIVSRVADVVPVSLVPSPFVAAESGGDVDRITIQRDLQPVTRTGRSPCEKGIDLKTVEC